MCSSCVNQSASRRSNLLDATEAGRSFGFSVGGAFKGALRSLGGLFSGGRKEPQQQQQQSASGSIFAADFVLPKQEAAAPEFSFDSGSSGGAGSAGITFGGGSGSAGAGFTFGGGGGAAGSAFGVPAASFSPDVGGSAGGSGGFSVGAVSMDTTDEELPAAPLSSSASASASAGVLAGEVKGQSAASTSEHAGEASERRIAVTALVKAAGMRFVCLHVSAPCLILTRGLM